MAKLKIDSGYQRPRHGPDCQDQIANFLVTETDKILEKSDFNGKIPKKDLISASEYASRLANLTPAHVSHIDVMTRGSGLRSFKSMLKYDKLYQFPGNELCLVERQGRERMFYHSAVERLALGDEPKEFTIKMNDLLQRARTQNYFEAIKLREMLQVIGFLHR